MRALLGTLLLLVALPAAADVFPSFHVNRCSVPAECVTCMSFAGNPSVGDECRAGAADAGLSKSDCTDSRSGRISEFWCPPGHPATVGCGCSSAAGTVGLLAAALAPLVLRRRRVRTQRG